MTRDEAERARLVFLAALNESNPLDPITDDYAVTIKPSCIYNPTAGPDEWEPRWSHYLIRRPAEEIHRAATIARASVGDTTACFICWAAGDERYQQCVAGNCQSVMAS